MKLVLAHLDNEDFRPLMLAELNDDLEAGRGYVASRLSKAGRFVWFGLLKQALIGHDAEWLAREISDPRYWQPNHSMSQGRPVSRRLPGEANVRLAEGEFLHYYIRGVCLGALNSGEPCVRVVRARSPGHLKPDSSSLEGQLLGAAEVRADLQEHHNAYSILGGPPGPTSGLAVERF